MRFYDGLNFKKLRGFVGKMFLESKTFAFQQHFPQRSSIFWKLNWHINLLFNARLKLGHSGILDMLFPFLAFFKLHLKLCNVFRKIVVT